MAIRQHEAVAIPPVRIARIELNSTSRHSTSAMSAIPIGAPGWPRIGLLNGIHRQGNEGIGQGRGGWA